MASQQYDISPEKRRILEENTKRKQALRELFLKERTNPFLHMNEAGTVFDKALLQHHAMQVTAYDHFRPNIRNSAFYFCGVILPILGVAWLVNRDRTKKETAMRNGLVAYKDRFFKFV